MVCCEIQTESQGERKGKDSVEKTEPEEKPVSAPAFEDLPETECPHLMSCVPDQLCDKDGAVSRGEGEMSKEERNKRGELIVRTSFDNIVVDTFIHFSLASTPILDSLMSAVQITKLPIILPRTNLILQVC